MRIIAGEFKGRHLRGPPGEGTRPMLDRVREAVFSTLGDRVEGARVLDLFAGTGSLGLEARSRGAAWVQCVERDRRMGAVLRQNAAELGGGERVSVVLGDALDPDNWGASPYDLLFLDPPYPLFRQAPGRRRILAVVDQWFASWAARAAVTVLHVPRYALLPTDISDAFSAEERAYGTNSLWYVSRAEGSAGGAGH